MISLRRSLTGVSLGLALVAATTRAEASPIVLYESAGMGATGQPGGIALGLTAYTGFPQVTPNYQDLGARFEVTNPAGVDTTSIGGHFVLFGDYPGFPGSHGNDQIFGAIVQLSGANDVPDSLDFSTPDVLGYTLIAPTVPSGESFGNLALHLNPGWYGVVFGGPFFGATGRAAAPTNGTQLAALPSLFFFNTTDGAWLNQSTDQGVLPRLVVNGTLSEDNRQAPVPEPTSMLLVGAGLAAAARRRLKK